MVVEGSQQETPNPGFVLLGTRQQGVPVILKELMFPGGFDPSYRSPIDLPGMVEPTGTYVPANTALLGHHDRQARPPRQGSSFGHAYELS
ncbi:unnamed protein product [Schistosoma curassoni]|uniref:Uncharacterized protein n=1 Tax=Schistosoma curassoni TaxID=6186 RepID=A0A183JCH5_9TREM|nr:unnamed protein product [Schistosoma curassoni]